MEEYSAWIILVLCKILSVLKYTVVLYVAIPLIIKFLPQVVAQGAFLNLVCPPLRFLKLSQPERWGLTNVINQYITGPDNLKLGLWHIRPEYDRHLQDAAKVLIYCHGNAGHRGFGHRNLIFKVFQSLGFHVIAFDYRGFGDSEGWPTQHGVIQDTVAVYEWVVQHTTSDCKIFIWGHSLGTSIATHAVAQVQENTSNPPRGLILESPFTSLNDAIVRYPLSKYLIRAYPSGFIKNLIHAAFKKTEIWFSTVDTLPLVKCPILILHSQDDTKVDFCLSEKLFLEMEKHSVCRNLDFFAFDKKHGFGHNNIHKYPQLSSLISDFENKSSSQNERFFSTVL